MRAPVRILGNAGIAVTVAFSVAGSVANYFATDYTDATDGTVFCLAKP